MLLKSVTILFNLDSKLIKYIRYNINSYEYFVYMYGRNKIFTLIDIIIEKNNLDELLDITWKLGQKTNEKMVSNFLICKGKIKIKIECKRKEEIIVNFDVENKKIVCLCLCNINLFFTLYF